MQKLSLELKIIGGVVLTLLVAIIIGAFVQVKERKVNDARTNMALHKLWMKLDSVSLERKAEHAIIISNEDTLKLMLRNFVWIIALFSMGRIC